MFPDLCQCKHHTHIFIVSSAAAPNYGFSPDTYLTFSSSNTDLLPIAYCGEEHQATHWNREHNTACTKIAEAREALKPEEVKFNSQSTGRGAWGAWVLPKYAPYLRARNNLLCALLTINTREALEEAYRHAKVLLIISDIFLGVEPVALGLYLQLSKDQECYGLIWWYMI